MTPGLGPLFRLYAVGCFGAVAAAAAAAWAVSVSPRCRDIAARSAVPAAGLSGAFFVAATIVMGLAKAAALNQYADRATHLEILWRASQGLGLTSPMSEAFFTGPHWFAAHFTPIVYLAYLPLFSLLPGQGVLCVLQTAYLALAAVPIFLFARKRLGTPFAGFLTTTFFLYPTTHYIALYGTAYLELSIPALAWALWAFEEDRDTAFIAALAAALAVREEVSLVTTVLGAYAFFRGRRRLGAGVTIASLAYFLVVLKLVIPSFRADGSLVYASNYGRWGSTPGEILLGVISHPVRTLGHMLSPVRVGNAVMCLLPLAALPLLDPMGAAIALPNVVTTFLSDSVTNYSFTLYYLSPMIPILFFSAARGAERLERRWAGSALPSGAAAAAASLACGVFFGPSPISRQFWEEGYRVGIFRSTSYHRSQYRPTSGARAAARIAVFVPNDAAVSAPQHLLPLLYDRKRMAVFPTLDAGIDHVLIDRSRTDIAGWAETFEDFRTRPEHYYAAVEKDPAWELAAEDGTARLYRRRKR